MTITVTGATWVLSGSWVLVAPAWPSSQGVLGSAVVVNGEKIAVVDIGEHKRTVRVT